MSTVTRRRALSLLPALGAAVAAPAAAVYAAPQEHPLDRVDRLMDELAEALSAIHDGNSFAMVYPATADRGMSVLASIEGWDKRAREDRRIRELFDRTLGGDPAKRVAFHTDELKSALVQLTGADWKVSSINYPDGSPTCLVLGEVV